MLETRNALTEIFILFVLLKMLKNIVQASMCGKLNVSALKSKQNQDLVPGMSRFRVQYTTNFPTKKLTRRSRDPDPFQNQII